MNTFINIDEKARILIVSPHPDDETIGCGGILAKYGSQCDVVVLTDGRLGMSTEKKQSEEELAEIRKREFESAMQFFCVNKFQNLGIPDSQLKKYAGKVRDIDLRNYDYVFIPNRNERHPDHASAYKIIKNNHRKQKSKADLIEYEVWSPLIAPNCFLDISDVMEAKIRGLEFYESQIELIDYRKSALGLNSYRGAPHHLEYCEAFNSIKGEKSLQKERIAGALPGGVVKLVRRVLIILRHR
jgi:LmbE family N-acetylglucosaminyl deacetylase